MAEKSKTVHVVELHGKAQNLQNALKQLQGDFKNIAKTSEIDGIFTKLENSLNSILRKTSKGIIPREDFAASEKELSKVKTQLDNLYNSISGFSKLDNKKLMSLIPDDTKKKLTDVQQAYAAYSATLDKTIKAEQRLAEATKKKNEAQLRANATENSRRGYAASATRANNELKKYQDVIEALKQQERATQDLEKAEKALDKARKVGKDEKFITSKQADRDVAADRKTSVDSAVGALDPKRIQAYEAAQKKVISANEKLAIATKEANNASKGLLSAQIAEESAVMALADAKNKSQQEIAREAQALELLKSALISINPEFKNLVLSGNTAGERLEELAGTIDGLTDDALKQLLSALQSAGISFEGLQESMDGTQAALNKTKEEVKGADQAIGDTTAFENRIKSFLGMSGAAQVMRRALRDAMATITELDATMTEMSVVTDLSVGDYWDQLPEYSARASELGVSINSAYKAATLYYQQGLKSNEVTAISTETLKMAKIAGMDAADATDKMTAALRGFNMELNEASAKRVSDVYSELAAVTAASTQEIANAMTKTASIAHSAGMEFETTAAFLSQIVETTRESAETAGTAMKTIIARFQELKKSPDEIGDVEGEIVDANAIETALRSVGVSLRDASGQFRELDDVFMELSSRWDSLDKNTQRYIATIAAGSRQQSRFIAMMSDYKRTQELVTKANASAGASQRQFEKTTESLEYKIEQLKNAWHEFTMGIMNSDLAKVGVDILTKFLNIVNKATSMFDGLAGSITKIAGVLVVFKMGQKIFEKLKAPLTNFFKEIIQEARRTGESAGEAAKEGLSKAKETKTSEKTKKQATRMRERMMHPDQGGLKGIKEAGGKVVLRVKGAASKLSDNVSGAKTDRKKKAQLETELAMAQMNTQGARLTGDVDAIIRRKAQEEAIQSQLDAINQRQQNRKGAVAAGAKNAANNTLSFMMGGHYEEAQKARAQAKTALQNTTGAMNKMQQAKASEQNSVDRIKNLEASNKALDEQKKKLAAIAQDESKSNKVRAQAQKTWEQTNNRLVKQERDILKEKENITTQQKEYVEQEKIFASESESYLDNQNKQWDCIGKGISSAGQALTGLGVGISMIGAAISESGLEGLGDTLSTIGQTITIVGTALLGLATIVPFLGKVIKTESKKVIIAGWNTQLAWWWVVLIVVAVIALIALIAVLVKNAKNNSAEAKLQQTKEAADEAAEAADRAAEAYENLASSLEELDGKYDSLDELTKGTEEWNKAVQDINNSVLDLIEQYPELAKFVENKAGVLTIDVDSADVQNILGQYQEKSITASAVALGMKANVSKAKAKVAYDQLGRKARISDADAYGNAEGTFEGKRKKRKEQRTEAVARALASGLMYEDNGTFVATEGSEQAIRDLGLDPDALDDFDNEVYESAEELKKYGQTLSQLDAETQAVYDAMATTALQLVDMSGWSEEEMSQAANLTDGADVKRFEEELQKKYLRDYGGNDDSSVTEDALREFMLSQEGVSEVKKIKNNKIVYIDDEGKKQKVDKETYIKKMIAAQATEKAADAAASTKFAVDNFAKDAGEALLTKGFSTEASSAAIDKLFADKSGGNLTAAELDMLGKLSEEQLKSMYGDNKDLQKLFASEEEFTKLFTKTLENGNDSLLDAREIQDKINKGQEEQLNIVQDFMKSGQAETYAKKMEEVFTRTGYAGAEAVQNALDSALAGQTDAQKQQILDTIDAYDWSDADELNNLQLQLWQTYGVGKEESWELINTIKKQNHSISSMATVVNEFGAMRQAADKLAVETQHLTELQNKYNEALREGSDAITGVLEDIADSYRNQYKLHGESYTAAMDNLSAVYAQGADKTRFGGNDMTSIVGFQTDENGNIVGLDTSNLANYSDLQSNAEVQSWLEDLQSWIDAGNEAKSGQQEVVEGLQSLQDETNEAYNELRSLVKESILNTMQEQIDVQRETLDATRDANDLLISKIQETITAQRTEEENEKTEQDIANMYSQMALLGMDTSGANDLQSQQMSEQIAEAEKAYEDTLIDQTLQSLSDANAQAAEQRERQIVLQEEALELYQNSAEFQASIDYAMNEILTSEQPVNEALSKVIVNGQTLGMSAKEREEYLSGYAAMVYQASLVSDDNFSLGDFAESYGITGKSLDSLRAASTQKAESARRSTLVNKGFTSAADSGTTVANMDTIDNILRSEDQGVIESSRDKIKSASAQGFFSDSYYDTEYDYYKNNQEAIMAGTKGGYTDYIKGIADNIADFENLTAADAFGGIAVPGSAKGFKDWKGKDQYEENEWFNATVNGTQDTGVKLGSKVTDGNLKTQLDKIHSATGGESMPYVYLATNAKGDTVDMLYYRQGGGIWWEVKNQNEGQHGTYPRGLRDAAKSYMDSKTERKYTKHKKYKTGGLADFTGPAWLDGTPSKPEYILNAEQTERFFSLVDVLKDYDSDKAQEKSGDNYFDIEINVEKLSSDYDVEQLADKIRRIIYNDATYRNVNAINRIR